MRDGMFVDETKFWYREMKTLDEVPGHYTIIDSKGNINNLAHKTQASAEQFAVASLKNGSSESVGIYKSVCSMQAEVETHIKIKKAYHK